MIIEFNHTVILKGPYKVVSKCKELLIQRMLCANCVRHHPKQSQNSGYDHWFLIYCFKTKGEEYHEVIKNLLFALCEGAYPSLRVSWSYEGEVAPSEVIFSFPPTVDLYRDKKNRLKVSCSTAPSMTDSEEDIPF